MKKFKKKGEGSEGELDLTPPKKFLASVSYHVVVNYNPQDMPPEYQKSGLYMESVAMVTSQVYTIWARTAQNAEDYVRAYVEESLPMGSKYDIKVEDAPEEDSN